MVALCRLLTLAAAALGLSCSTVAAQEIALSPQTGTVSIREAQASLELSEDYVFYDAADARRILTDVWGNSPADAQGVLGMVMRAGSTPHSDAWGAVVTFQRAGYVSDDDARDADYAAVLREMQVSTTAANATRRADGFGAVEVIGWAQVPRYDSVDHAVVWARELRFEGEPVNTLNYDLRKLGRSGVLSINLVTTMPHLREIRDVADDLAQATAFDPGAQYDDFNAGTDETAGYGIAGLVAGGAGLAVAKKVGLVALLLQFLKPLLVGLTVLLGLFAGPIWRRLRSMRGRAEPSL